MDQRDQALDDEIASLARQLQGALEVAQLYGVEHLPRPPAAFQAAPAPRATPARPAPDARTDARTDARADARPLDARTDVRPDVRPEVRRPTLSIVQGEEAAAIAKILEAPISNAEKLAALNKDVIGDCARCKLHRGRSKLVFGVGHPEAELCFVGEGPGADEDRQGIPFVGAAGQLLTKMINAMGFARDEVYICNVVKCRPPNNRDPEPDEVDACEGFLKAQLAIVKPKVIVALGRYAAQTLLRSKTPITRMRGNWFAYEGIDLMPTYHPSFLLREEGDPEKKRKREAWADLQQVMKRFGKTPVAR